MDNYNDALKSKLDSRPAVSVGPIPLTSLAYYKQQVHVLSDELSQRTQALAFAKARISKLEARLDAARVGMSAQVDVKLSPEYQSLLSSYYKVIVLCDKRQEESVRLACKNEGLHVRVNDLEKASAQSYKYTPKEGDYKTKHDKMTLLVDKLNRIINEQRQTIKHMQENNSHVLMEAAERIKNSRGCMSQALNATFSQAHQPVISIYEEYND